MPPRVSIVVAVPTVRRSVRSPSPSGPRTSTETESRTKRRAISSGLTPAEVKPSCASVARNAASASEAPDPLPLDSAPEHAATGFYVAAGLRWSTLRFQQAPWLDEARVRWCHARSAPGHTRLSTSVAQAARARSLRPVHPSAGSPATESPVCDPHPRPCSGPRSENRVGRVDPSVNSVSCFGVESAVTQRVE